MNQSVATVTASGSELEPVTMNDLTEFLTSLNLATPLSDKEKQQFIKIALAWGLNPFKREIYVSKYNGSDGFSVIVGFEVYLKRAERSGKLDGWEAEFHSEGDDLSCVVTIYRKDWSRPFKHEAFYEECVQKTRDGQVTKFWKKKRLMTRKVAISQAFRMAFPDELGGMPYTPDEMGVEVQDTTHEVVSTRTSAQQRVDAIAQPVEQALEAKPVVAQEAAKPRLTKQQTAEVMKALDAWNKALGAMVEDPNRNESPDSYQVAATALGAIENLDRKEQVTLFKGLKEIAFNHGVDYDKDSKLFYSAEPVAEGEEVSDAVQ